MLDEIFPFNLAYLLTQQRKLFSNRGNLRGLFDANYKKQIWKIKLSVPEIIQTSGLR